MSHRHVQPSLSHGGYKVARQEHGEGKLGPIPPRVVWVKTSTRWVAETVAR